MTIPISQETPPINFATLDLLPYGIIVVDEQGWVLYYNAREEQISKRKRDSVIGRNFFSEVAPCTQVQAFHGRFQETMRRMGDVANFTFRFPFPGQPREVQITMTSFENQGAPLCLIAVNDITEQEALRETIVRGERLREVGEVAAGVAHNFNNLLSVICGNAELLKRGAKGEKANRYLEIILQASNDAVQMVKRIQESTRQERHPSDPRASVDLNQLIRDSIEFTAEYARAAGAERGVKVDVVAELAEELPPVPANAASLREVLVNLIRNAVDAMNQDGRIIIRSVAESGKNRIEVIDAGEGMTDAVKEKLFRPLFTTKSERGTGLGLATSYAIVRRHGGDIEVTSAPGAGTTFIVRLPVGPGDS